MKYPYLIKDFTKPKQYPDPEKKHGAELAWEFLRRNGDYQKSVDTFLMVPTLKNQDKFMSQWGFFPDIPLFKLKKIQGKLKRVFHYDPKTDSPPRLKLAFKRHPRIVKAPIGANIVSPNKEKGDSNGKFQSKSNKVGRLYKRKLY